MVDDDNERSASSLDFRSPLDEENRKSIAQYAYQIDRTIRDVWFREGRMIVRTRDGAPLGTEIRTAILSWAEKLASESPDLGTRVMRERRASATVGGTPLADLRRSGLMMEEGPGLVGLRGAALSFRRVLDESIRRHALERRAVEHEYPPLLELETLAQSAYLGNFPQHVFFLSETDRDAASVEVVRRAKVVALADPSFIDRALTTSSLVVSPTICFHCFRVHRGQVLPRGPHLFTALGQCGRKEPFVGPADRLQLFTMREIISFGAADQVESERQHWMDFAWELTTRLDLTARIVIAFDPFFVFTNKKKIYQRLTKAKYELQIRLPEEERWCAVASFNHHEATLTRAFGIRVEEGTPLQSGCVGFGYERLIVAVAAQRGLTFAALEAVLTASSGDARA
jgi:seryl-tRNA synthetase